MGSLKRQQIVEQLTARLSLARLQISLILVITAFAGFVISAGLLRLGLTSMTLRYPIAIMGAYVCFLFLLRLWLRWQSDEPISDLDIGDVIITDHIAIFDSARSTAADSPFSGGADFAGAGAGGDWAETDGPIASPVGLFSSSGGESAASTGSGGMDLDVDLDDGAALLIVGVILLLVFSAFIYVVWIAPVLLAELIVDAAVVSALYKPVKNIPRRHWLLTAVKKTAVPAAIVALLFGIAGAVMQSAEPDAVTIGQFLSSM